MRTLVYHFANEPTYGMACTALLKRIEQQDFHGLTSANVLADVAHRLMTLEAISLWNWPAAGIAARLRKQRTEIAKLTVFSQAIVRIPLLGIQVLTLDQNMVGTATQLSGQYHLLTGDALVVAVMLANGLTNLASNDDDFDNVPHLVRYAPA
jgi:predicted nucleic acid-binding protein